MSLANPNCKLMIWTWGLFEVKAAIEDERGNVHHRSHNLEYDRELETPGAKFVKV